MQTLPKSTVTFLQTYLKKWDGQKNQGIVLDLLSYLPLQPFEGDLPVNYVPTFSKTC